MQKVPKFGQKTKEPDLKLAEDALEELKKCLLTQVNRKKEIGKDFEGLFELPQNSNFSKNFGQKVDSKHLVFPEEAFFLTTKQQLCIDNYSSSQILLADTPISEVSLYSTLKRKGVKKIKRPSGQAENTLKKFRGESFKKQPETPSFVCEGKALYTKSLEDTLDPSKELVCVNWTSGFQFLKLKKWIN